MKCQRWFTQTTLCLFILFSPLWGRAEIIRTVDTEALEILKQMNDYLLSQPDYRDQ